jgi:type IV secretory pathway VirB10-like protein
MADDVEINVDEGVIDKAEGSEEIEESEEKTGFLKSKLFKIIVGVMSLLLIAGGAYFFLAPADDPEDTISESVSEENIIEDATAVTKPDDGDIDNLENNSDLNPVDASSEPHTDNVNSDIENPAIQEQETSLESIESQEKTAQLQEENLRMQQQIRDLEAKINQQEKITQDQQSIQGSNVIAPIRNPSSVDYQQDFFDESSMREPNRTPPPKPSWGEFDRINNK